MIVTIVTLSLFSCSSGIEINNTNVEENEGGIAESLTGYIGQPGLKSGDPCQCWGIDQTSEPACQCIGPSITHIPSNLTADLTRLTISQSSMKVITNDSLLPYRNLKDFTLIHNNNLEYIEPGLFAKLPSLTAIYVAHAPSLQSLDEGLLRVSLPKLKILSIIHTGLNVLPHLNQLNTDSHLSQVDLENNQITRIGTGQINITVEHLFISYNKIQMIERGAFQGSQIDTLNLRGNRELTSLHSEAFRDIRSLRQLDLSETSIIHLPTLGLQYLEVLEVQYVRTLKVFPSIYNFPSVRKVYLTYAYHCCAFHFPARHDPDRHEKHQKFILKQQESCTTGLSRKKRDAPSDGFFHEEDVTVEPGKRMTAFCGNISKDYRGVECHPEPDAFNPCEDLMGNWGLRLAVWAVALLALFGNTAVLLVLLSSRYRMTVPKFLMCNLALADFCMGLYLLLIAIMDARSIGDYFNYAIDWQIGLGCKVAGFLTVFSSELSILTLTVITSERWYTITYAIHMNRRLKLSTAAKIMAAGWVYALLMAALPLCGISGYFKTSICLPMENTSTWDLAYLATLLTFNGLAFWVICACYGRMYCSIRRGQENGAPLTQSDMTVAKRMALLVFTDFACWAPIAFFGLTALAGYPLIDVTNTKILLVFFYPLNSCANPYLYALLTHQYRRDVLILLSRYGMCAERAARYKGTGGGGGGAGAGAGGGGPEGGRGGRGPGHRGSLLTTLTSLDCARQASLTAVPEISLQMDSLPNQVPTDHHGNGTSRL